VSNSALAADQTTSKIGANMASIISIELSGPLLPDPRVEEEGR
jgi:hypothetical protein